MYDRFGRTLAYLDKADGWDYSVEAAPCGCCPFLRLSRPSLGPSRRDCSCRTGSDGRWPGPVGTAVLRPNDLSTNLIRRGAFAQRSGRAGGPSVGAQYLRDGDVVALEFTGVAGGGAVYGWG